LGLSLATEHVRRMGGRLDFTPRDGGGTEARITLPSG
jgi:signal transduction histidine kinase